MSATARDAHRPAAAVLLSALQRVLASNTFSRSERLRAFLSYVVETELENGGAQLKGYTIAIDVFGRPAAFDADGDPLVRVHAGKLRKLLDAYYETEGADEEWRIVIPKGSYVPEYHRRQPAAPVETPAAEEPENTAASSKAGKPHAAPRRMAIRPRRSWLPAPISSHFALLSVLPLLIVAPLATPAMSINSGLGPSQAASGLQLERTQDLPQVTVSGQWPRRSLPARFADTVRTAASHFRTVSTRGTRLRSTQLSFTITVADDEETNGVKISVVNDLTADSVFTTVIESERLEDESDLLFESVSLANRVLTLDGAIYRYARAQGLESPLMSCMALTETYRREQTKDAFHSARKCQDGLPIDRRNTLQFIVSAGALPGSLER
ncbi:MULTISPECIES: hypothetical protein [unclassified Rhizobium]|uniref:hypothetical protein n=1 Tax=unclassified Rhizobium TaxID=2613769 RepID=UPI0006FB0D49|nr:MULTISPECIES: hypothetical protein [unclassified Rhizobium]KQV34587.1 hypothetical protein ASC86_13710 [Rhizobium sp. Root1212]KRD23921.1 hypothetical protein ASE37_13705 [Rhizobium sp. Root268]